ncbi:MAG: DNA primase, partial [Cyanobacteria bacterium 0813]|nr:DNA primase [Cyanobacteria bacterium 0813]
DAATNQNVNWEQRKLGRQILKFNVPVYSVTGGWDVKTEIEEGEIEETKGMDDIIQHLGIQAFRHILSHAITFDEWESKTFDKDGSGGDGGSKDKYLVRKSTTFEAHCWKNLFGDDWIVINDAFYQWNGRYWQLQADADVNKLLADFTRDCYQPGAEVDKNFKFGTSKYLDSAFKYCRKALHKKFETSTVHLKSFANGTVDLKTGKLFPHDKQHYLLSCSPCDYVAGSDIPPEFKKFLLSAYGAEQIETIRILTSMYLDPTAPSGKFAYVIGDSGSGKGLLLRTWANLLGAESSVSSNSLSELTKPEGRHQLLTNKSFFYVPDTGGYLSELKAFYELVDNGPMSGRALFSSSGYQKKWDVRFAVASVEHIQTENSGDGWDRRCIPLQTKKRELTEDPDLCRKLAAELGEIAGWALSMDRAERDRVLMEPSINPAVIALKQEGAILGDSIRGFVDRCFRPGKNHYVGADLHSWYVAYCKAHNNTPQGYNKFVHHLKRVLANQYRASTVVREGETTRRIPAGWYGLEVLPCFTDLAVNSEEDNHTNRPHLENWVCLKTKCEDGGLQELTRNLAVTDVTTDLSSVTPSRNAETRMVTDVTLLQGESSQHEQISPLVIADNPNTRLEGEPLSDVTPVTTTVTPTFEPSEKPCNSSKICNNSQPSEQVPIAPSEPEAVPTEPTAQSVPPIAPPELVAEQKPERKTDDQVVAEKKHHKEFKEGDRVVITEVGNLHH